MQTNTKFLFSLMLCGLFDAFDGKVAHYETSILPECTGLYQVATRIYPKNPELPPRPDFPLVEWL